MAATPPPNADIADLVALLGEDSVRILIRTFLREYPIMLQQLSTGDRKTQHRMSHSLKSNARIIGARDLSARMAEYELRLANPEMPDLNRDEIAGITTDFATLAKMLRTYIGEA